MKKSIFQSSKTYSFLYINICQISFLIHICKQTTALLVSKSLHQQLKCFSQEFSNVHLKYMIYTSTHRQNNNMSVQ